MAIDNLLGERLLFNDHDVILRTYFWANPTLSCGYHQRVERRIDYAACKRFGVDLARRPTGGRELLHDGDMSFSLTIASNAIDGDLKIGAREFFVKAAGIIVEGLNECGVMAEVQTGKVKGQGGHAAPCLAVVSQYEIVAGGKKIVPMAQRVYNKAIMVHGSIPLKSSAIPTSNLILSKDSARMQAAIEQSSTDLSRVSGQEIKINDLKNGIKRSFEGTFSKTALTARIGEEYNSVIGIEQAKWEINEG